MSLEEPETGGEWARSLRFSLLDGNSNPDTEIVSERDGEIVTDGFGINVEDMNPKISLLVGALEGAGDGHGLRDPAILLGLVKDCLDDPTIEMKQDWLWDFGSHLQEICDFGDEPNLESGLDGKDGSFAKKIR